MAGEVMRVVKNSGVLMVYRFIHTGPAKGEVVPSAYLAITQYHTLPGLSYCIYRCSWFAGAR